MATAQRVDPSERVGFLIDEAEKILRAKIAELKAIETIEIPSYVELRDKETFISVYSDVINQLTELAALISFVRVRGIELRDARSMIPNLVYPQMLKSKHQAILESLAKNYFDLVEAARVQKDALDQSAKFLSSAQFVLGGLIQ